MTAAPLTLAIETSTPLGGVALGRDGALLGEVVVGERTRHAEAILPAARFLLDSVGGTTADIGRIVVGAGPGSFTGVRIAAATAKGLAHALGVPLHAFPSLAAAAADAAPPGRPVCALFDARREEVYAACYRFPPDGGAVEVLAPAARALADVLADALPLGAVFAGEGARLHAQAIRAAGGVLAPTHLGVPRPSALLRLAAADPAAGLVAAADWEPDYLRPSGAERRAS